MREIQKHLTKSASLHRQLCPRQVLGVRMGMYAGRFLSLDLPQTDKRLLTIAETDGCFVDGVSAATGCWVGRRTLRVEDYGKVATTFIDTRTERSVRIAPRADVRTLAEAYAPDERSSEHTQLLGYQRMPDELLFSWQAVVLHTPIKDIISRPGVRTNCQVCGEEIINEREVVWEDSVVCRSCAGLSYYTPLPDQLDLQRQQGISAETSCVASH
jgi:formylmethanofuran dehydrogenase subunit E